MSGGTTIVFRYDGSTWSPYYGSLNAGETYAIAVRQAPDDPDNPGAVTADYYLIGYDGTSGLVSHNIGPSTNDANTFLSSAANSNYRLMAFGGTTGLGEKLAFADTITQAMDACRYLAVNSTTGLMEVSSTTTAYDWRYEGVDPLTYKSRLWTVQYKPSTTQYYIDVVTSDSGYYFSAIDNDPNTTGVLYSATLQANGNYTVDTSTPATSAVSGNTYVFVISKGGNTYYAWRQSTSTDIVQAVGMPQTFTPDYVWVAQEANNRTSLYGVDGSGRQLCIDMTDGCRLYTPESARNCYWTYSATPGTARFEATTAANAGEVSLYKVTKNTDFDAVTDVCTRLNGKAEVTPSLSVTSAGYLLVAQVAGDNSTSYYSLAVASPEKAVTLDITDIFTDTLAGDNITVFDASVWDQLGSDYRLIFDNNGFDGTDYYLMTGSHTSSQAQPCLVTVSDFGGDVSAYTWNLHTQSTGYLLGYSDASHGTPVETYLYFDASSLTFRLTTDEKTAQAGTQVTMYQLHNETDDIIYQTFSIAMASDGVTVQSLPLVKAGTTEITQFGDDTDLGGIIDHRIDGEYVILAIYNNRYYALTYNAHDALTFVDVSLLFAGNKSLMQPDTNIPAQYCLSVNNNYIWQQKGTVTTSSDMANGLSFYNVGQEQYLSLGGVTTGLSYTGAQIFATNGGSVSYLNFTTQDGYTVSGNTSDVSIYLYAVGVSGTATGGSHSHAGGQYVYFEEGLPTSGADYSNFSHIITTISDLKQYMMTYAGIIDWETGWSLEDGSKMTDADYSVLFGGGIAFDSGNFASTFKALSATYNVRDTLGNATADDETVIYYAPAGAVAFVVPYATTDHPVFVNVIATTEQTVDSYDNTLRWLALWKAADINAQSGALTVNGKKTGLTAADYANALRKDRNTPYAAIPLPNSTGNATDGATDVYLSGVATPYHLNTLSTTTDSQTVTAWDHLIAHTFEINEPGVYYIGSTAGSVAYSYISIYDKYLSEEDEDGSVTVSENFTVDFVWGTYSTDCAGDDDYGTDKALGTIAYVGKTGSAGETWRHSNIQPEFVEGTAGLYSGTTQPDVYAPVDDLVITVERKYDSASGVSTIRINLEGTDGTKTAGVNGDGQVKLINSNTPNERKINTYEIAYAR